MAILNKAYGLKKKKKRHPVFDFKERRVLFLIWALVHEEAPGVSCPSVRPPALSATRVRGAGEGQPAATTGPSEVWHPHFPRPATPGSGLGALVCFPIG